jgi:dynein heavy chain, axonemal
MLVGATCSGKTTCYKILADAMTHLRKQGIADKRFQEVNFTVLNPKCISMGELYGEVNPYT